MLKKLYFLTMLISILFIFSGCSEFFTFNLFDGMDYVGVPTAEKLSEKPPAEGVAYLKEQMDSDSFLDAVTKDETAVAEITAYLEDIYTDTTVEEETRVSAAVLAADLDLAVTGGDEFINNVFNALTDIQGFFAGTETVSETTTIATILAALLPAEIAQETDPAVKEVAFTDLLTGLITAGEIYLTLGDSIITDPAQADAATVYADITGGVVMNAIVAGLITSVVDTMLLPDYQEPAVAAGVLLGLLQDIQNGVEPDTTGINLSADMSTVLSDLTYLENIALAAGADLSSLLGETTVQ